MTRSSMTAPNSVTAPKAGILAASTLAAVFTLAAAFTLVASRSALANDGPVFKKRHDKDITIVIIDDKDHDRKRFVTEDKRKPGAATTFQRPDDEIRIRIPRDSNTHHGGRHGGHQAGNQENDEDGRYRAGNDATTHGGSGYDRSGHSDTAGDRSPKIIIVDRSATPCKGSGVCVIRP